MELQFVTMDQLRVHTKADGDDDDLLLIYALAAEDFCVAECQVGVYVDQAALDAARAGCSDTLRDALLARKNLMDAADAEEDETVAEYMRANAERSYQDVRFTLAKIERGKVVTDAFCAAVLLIAGHLYRNKEEVTSGINHGATKLPVGYKHFLHQFSRYGV